MKQSYDLYVLVRNPLDYRELSEQRVVAKKVVIGTLVGFHFPAIIFVALLYLPGFQRDRFNNCQ